jgi:dihydrofolate reductase
MSRLVMWNLITLDGFFEGEKPWDLKWHEYVWGEELESFSLQHAKSTDRLLFGRATYEGMAAHWPAAEGPVAEFMNAVPKVVFSRTLERVEWANTTLVDGDAVAKVEDLKRTGDGNTMVFGSADLSATLMEHDLFDEYQLAIVPVILGKGRPLFGRGLTEKRLQLLDTRTLSTGGVILRYVPDRG